MRSAPLHGIVLRLSTTELDFGQGIDGLISMSGMRRLEEDHGAKLSALERSLTFDRPPFVLLDCRTRKRGTREIALRRLTAWRPQSFCRAWRKTLKHARASHLQPHEFLQINRVAIQATGARRADLAEAAEREQRLREEFADVFSTTLEGPPDWRKQQDTLVRLPTPDPRLTPSFKAMHARVPQSREQDEFRIKEIDDLLNRGILREDSTSPYNAPSFCVEKDPTSPDLSRRWRMVLNFRAVNRLFPPMPTFFEKVPDILRRLSSSEWLGAADLTAGFHQIAVHPEDQQYLVISDPRDRMRKYRFTAWPFGFSWAPYAMQTFGEP